MLTKLKHQRSESAAEDQRLLRRERDRPEEGARPTGEGRDTGCLNGRGTGRKPPACTWRSVLCFESRTPAIQRALSGIGLIILPMLNKRSHNCILPFSLPSCYVALSRHPLLVVDPGRSPYLRVKVGSMRDCSSLSKHESLVLNVETDDHLPGVSATQGFLL